MRSSGVRVLLASGLAALTAACINLGLGGGEASPQAQYRLDDLSPKMQARSAPIDRRLLVSPMASESVGDTYSMAYTRAEQQRQFYQFASWTDRPTSRIVQLLIDRIDARRLFESVSRLGGGIGGGLILNIGVNEFIHDVSAGAVRVEVTAELIERRGRTLVDRKRFTASAPVAAENAPAAVAAFSRASTTLLDELVPWLERHAELLPPPEPRRAGKS